MLAMAARGLCRLLMVTVMMLSFQSAWAGMIGTQQMVAAGSPTADRLHVQDLLSRTELQRQLTTLGVDPQAVQDRVAALTDQEVQELAGKLQTAPAGGIEGLIWLAVILIVGLMIWGSLPPRRR